MIPLDFTIQTKRLKLRSRTIEDNSMIFSATRFHGFNDGLTWEPPETERELIPRVEQAKERWLKEESFTFIIEYEQQSIGMISISKKDTENTWTMGYFLHPKFQGNGFMTESVKAIIDFGFSTLKAEIIEAQCATWNTKSEKVLVASGMQLIEKVPRGFMKKGSWVMENKYQILV